MKEQIDTIPVNEAFASGDECPFCYMERQAEQMALRYTVGPGASYMEPDVRETTNRQGFCGAHLKKIYDYGNSLGSALILQTWLEEVQEELEAQTEAFSLPAKKGLFSRKGSAGEESAMVQWGRQRFGTCYVCGKVEYNMERYVHTFFVLLKDAEFRAGVEGSKGFCMRHFLHLMERAEQELPNGQQAWFYQTVLRLMRENLSRVKGDLDWFVDKFDYRNAGADWKNSRDAVSRTMQKLQGIYPADPPYRSEPR